MYNSKTGVIVLGSNRNKNTIYVVREMKTEIKIDCSSRIIKDKIRRVVVEGPADKDFTVHLSEYRYNEPFVQIYMALRPEVLDRTIYSVTLKNELDYDMMLYDAINDTKNELMRKWEVIRENIVTPEYINDLDELIDALAYATLNGEFECKKDT